MKTPIDFSRLVEVVNSGLCCGCGTCGAVCQTEAISFPENKEGFCFPQFMEEKCASCGMCVRVCPNIELNYRDHENQIKEKPPAVFTGFSCNTLIRKNGSSGGLLTQFLLDGLATGLFDAVVVCRSGSPDNFAPVLTNSSLQVAQGKGAKYTQIPQNLIISQIMEASFSKICYVGLPCQIRGLQSLIKTNKSLRDKITLTCTMVCGQNLSREAVRYQLAVVGKSQEPPSSYTFRGEGWPGSQTINFSTGMVVKIPYNSRLSMGGIFSSPYFSMKACLACVDHLGLDADLTFCDAWHKKGEDSQGLSSVIVWNKKGEQAVDCMQSCGHTELKKDSIAAILQSQGHLLSSEYSSIAGKLMSYGFPHLVVRKEEKTQWVAVLKVRVYFSLIFFLKRIPHHVIPWRVMSFSRHIKRLVR